MHQIGATFSTLRRLVRLPPAALPGPFGSTGYPADDDIRCDSYRFEDELLAKPYTRTWQEIVNWCKVKTVYRLQKLLAEQACKPRGRINSLIIEHEEDPEAPFPVAE